jgi:hypothetical protein
MVSVNGKMKKVARLVCEEIYGPIGALVAAHKPNIGCIGAMCVNPEHTYPATVQQNCMDKPSELRIKMASIGGKANGGWNKGMKMYRGKYR